MSNAHKIWNACVAEIAGYEHAKGRTEVSAADMEFYVQPELLKVYGGCKVAEGMSPRVFIDWVIEAVPVDEIPCFAQAICERMSVDLQESPTLALGGALQIAFRKRCCDQLANEVSAYIPRIAEGATTEPATASDTVVVSPAFAKHLH